LDQETESCINSWEEKNTAESSDGNSESESSLSNSDSNHDKSESSISSLSSSTNKMRQPPNLLLSRKQVIFTDHLRERCWERGI
jgi:hypothetical protein